VELGTQPVLTKFGLFIIPQKHCFNRVVGGSFSR